MTGTSDRIGVAGRSPGGYGIAASSDSGVALNAVSQTGRAVYAASGADTCIFASSGGSDHPSVHGVKGRGGGNAILGQIVNEESRSTAVVGETEGPGSGIRGTSARGRGGLFRGPLAQIRLDPAEGATHPASGSAGDLFVDKRGRLWFCKGGRSWKQLA